jgi:LysM repeat protein
LLAAMPERQPNQIARVAAVVALVTAFMLVTFTLFTSGGGSNGGSDGNGTTDEIQIGEPTRAGEKALERGFYVVEDGDTLAQIAQDTGLELDNLVELNPELDPQALIAGERVRLP